MSQYQYHCETQAVPVAGDCGCRYSLRVIGGALYSSDVDMSGNGETVAEQGACAGYDRCGGYDL